MVLSVAVVRMKLNSGKNVFCKPKFDDMF